MNILKSVLVVALLGFSSGSYSATNVALNANVTLNGVFGGTDGVWGTGTLAAASTLTDGVFIAPETQPLNQWNQNTVYWYGDANRGQNNITIDMNGQYSISSLILQADNNDIYPIYYRNGNADTWHSVWDVPTTPGWGMMTRSDILGAPIIATSFQIRNGIGDNDYSVSEFQAIGAPVPEPEIYAMMFAGLGLIGFMTRHRKNEQA